MARPFTFIHTADLHLDAPFKGVDAGDERVRGALVDSTYAALDRIVGLAIARRADFVVIAGDAYNSKDKSLRAQLRFRTAMERLAGEDIDVYVVQGNHDPADGFSARLELPSNVHYFSTALVEKFEIRDEKDRVLCVLHGRGYATAATKTNLAKEYSRGSETTAIGVLHANVGGVQDYEPYAPCTLDDLKAARMDYWALGHIHKPTILADSPPVRYSGSPQGLNPKEDGEHGCWIVTMDAGRISDSEFVETAAVRWAREIVDISDLDTVDDVRSALRDACAAARHTAGDTPVVMRIDVMGRGDAHGALSRGTDFQDLVTELRSEELSNSPWLWLDRVRNLTRPALDVEFLLGVEDFTGDLARLARDLITDPDAASAFVAEALSGIDAAFGRRDHDAVDLIERARDECLDRLVGGDV
ncbi:MAG: metallophosphoesterase family protein [Coriobacteriia bacterium]